MNSLKLSKNKDYAVINEGGDDEEGKDDNQVTDDNLANGSPRNN